jgi:glycopeptide antibiotics resistance protein
MSLVLALLIVGVVAVLLVPRRLRLPVWTALIVAAVVPWTHFQDHAHWQRVEWVPFAAPLVRLGDVAGNLLLYLPFGLHFPLARRGRWARTAGCVASALVLSAATEATQVYSHGRFPSMTDVAMNAVGAVVGIVASFWVRAGTEPAGQIPSLHAEPER